MCTIYVVFSEGQVYCEFQQAALCEAVEEPWDEFPDMNVLPPFSRALGNSFARNSDFKGVYTRLVSTYSNNDRTYETDTLNAFTGILNQLRLSFGIQFT